MTWGPLLEEIERAGVDLESAPFWKDRPEVRLDLEWVLEAFYALSGSRYLGFGAAGPIPFEAIDRYAVRHGIVDDEWEFFSSMLNALQAAWFEWRAETKEAAET